MTWVLFAVTLALAIWSLTGRSADRIAALLIAVALIFSSGLRRDGYDYGNYVKKIEDVRKTASLDFEYRLIYAKDPMMIWVTDMVTLVDEENTWPVFLAFAFIAVFTKYLAALSLPRYSAVFLAIYLIFISPTLEFSGIRQAAGNGFMLMCVAYQRRWRAVIPLMVLSVASHISLFFSAMACLMPRDGFRRWHIELFTLATALATYLLSDLFGHVQRGEAYVGITGTVYAMLFPVIGCTLFFGQLRAVGSKVDRLYLVIAVNIGLSLGLAFPNVGVSHRLLEIGLSVLLFGMVRDWATGVSRRNARWAVLVMVTFIAFETFHHLLTGNWLAITIV